jgi:hypothetical protein
MPYVNAIALRASSLHFPRNIAIGAYFTGIDWTTITPWDDATPAQTQNEIWNMCARATAKVDGYCNQTLRATADDELLHGPDFKVTVGPGGGGSSPTPYWGGAGYNARLILARWPVLEVTAVQTCPNNMWPRSWTSVPAGYFEPETPPIGIYGSSAPGGSAQGGQAVILAPGYITWAYGRNGWAVQVSYINGWPHSEVTVSADAGDSVITVDDTTGWAVTNYYGTYTGATGRIPDSGQQEAVRVTSASVKTGPGTLTLATPLVYPHEAGTLITSLPASIEEACILFATAEALVRGATSTTIHDIGGHSQATGGDITGLNTEAELLCHPFRRTV